MPQARRPLVPLRGSRTNSPIDGILRGAWRRTVTGRAVTVEVRPFRPLSKDEKAALADAVARYGTFLGLPAKLVMTSGGRRRQRS